MLGWGGGGGEEGGGGWADNMAQEGAQDVCTDQTTRSQEAYPFV